MGRAKSFRTAPIEFSTDRPRFDNKKRKPLLDDRFEQASIQAEMRFDDEEINTYSCAAGWGFDYFKDRGLHYFLSPYPGEYIPVYPSFVRQFYQSLSRVAGEGQCTKRYKVTVSEKKFQFTTDDISAIVFDGFHKNAKIPLPKLKDADEIIGDMCRGRKIKPNVTHKVYLPPHMWIVDDIARANLYPKSDKYQRRNMLLQVLYWIYKDVPFPVAHVLMDCMFEAQEYIRRHAPGSGIIYFPRLITKLLQRVGFIRFAISKTYPMELYGIAEWRANFKGLLTYLIMKNNLTRTQDDAAAAQDFRRSITIDVDESDSESDSPVDEPVSPVDESEPPVDEPDSPIDVPDSPIVVPDSPVVDAGPSALPPAVDPSVLPSILQHLQKLGAQMEQLGTQYQDVQASIVQLRDEGRFWDGVFRTRLEGIEVQLGTISANQQELGNLLRSHPPSSREESITGVKRQKVL